jgi:hypothetical protein
MTKYSDKTIWKNIERIGLVISILASGIALIISIRSCSDSNEALEISRKEFQAKRLLILKSELGNTSPGFEFRTFDNNQKLQKLLIYFPSQFCSNPLTAEPPEFYFDISELQDSLLIILKRNIPNYKPTDRIYIQNIPIAAIIVSNYVVAGEALSDSSLYNFESSFRQEYFNNSSETQIEFKNLIFKNRLSEESDFDRSLEDDWLENFNSFLKAAEIN